MQVLSMLYFGVISRCDFCCYSLLRAIATQAVIPLKVCTAVAFAGHRGTSRKKFETHGMRGVSGSNPLGSISRTNQSLTSFSAAFESRLFSA